MTPARVRLAAGLADAIAAHARREAPRECCGVLIGQLEDGCAHVVEARPGTNIAASHDLYELDPEDFVRADAAAGDSGLTVIGFYHSHPRGPGLLSHVDRARAWPGYIYLLIAPEIGSASGFSAWVQPSEGRDFIPLDLGL